MSATSSTLSRRTVLAASAAAGAANLLPGAAIAADNTDERTAIRPFSFRAPEPALAEMRRRVSAAIWPEQETVADASQGVQLATMQKLARYWATDYDWRKVEARINALPQLPHRDRRTRHPLHSRPLEARECVADDRHAWMARLDHRAAEDRRSVDQPDGAWRERSGRLPPRDPVDAGLRVLGQAGRERLGPRAHRAGLGRADEAPRLHEVRGAGRRLGRR